MENMHSGNYFHPLPYTITRSDFLKLSRLYQLAALALQETGKVRIVDDSHPSTDLAPSSEGYRNSCDQRERVVWRAFDNALALHNLVTCNP
jgi:hypothetical protein